MARWSPPPASAARWRWSIARRADLARTLVGPGLPVWSVAFLPDSRTLLTGGADNIIRRWNAVTGEPVDPFCWKRREIPSPPMPATAARKCFAPASPAIRLAPIRPTGRGRRWPAFSAGGSQPCRAIIFRKPQAPRYRLDTGDGFEIVRGRTCGLHARHQDARAAHRLRTGPRRAGAIPRARDEAVGAFSSEVGTGSREESASKQELERRSDFHRNGR